VCSKNGGGGKQGWRVEYRLARMFPSDYQKYTLPTTKSSKKGAARMEFRVSVRRDVPFTLPKIYSSHYQMFTPYY